ncbi:RHS repeat-associated core domain-containing protein [Rhizobacter sp. SG703]|uniref:RHS repeat-associated core domain-containing protein n=1 Tax=Rhizobacter sp. SG703 TaxID=2587140 RepID=UPI001446AF20|nr:RHS repeat-associated core domain-containing protein [Rhizobacter sp. SG703]NKI96968.1 RHS repeat-associated protein [Rhizobacter sp. SG703]
MKTQTFLALAIAMAPLCTQAQGTPVANPYDQTRTTAFTYRSDGLLETERIEPDNAQLCVVTTHSYDDAGNKQGVTTANCAGATGRAIFDSRSSTTTYAAQTLTVAGVTLTTPAGTFATSAANALGHGEQRIHDPRFGTAVSITGPNNLTTRWTLDDFGRPVRELRADGTSTVTFYCTLQGRGLDSYLSANSAACATLAFANGEVPADAVTLVHSETHGSTDARNGPFSRVYTDRAGRKLRSVSEAFDGANQPGGAARLVVQDVDYNAFGTQVLSTQPYFLDSGSSTAAGTAGYGMSATEVDVLGRVTASFTVDVQGTGNQGGSTTHAFAGRGTWQSARTVIEYAGLTTTTTNDKGESRKEEKDIEGKPLRVTDALGAQSAYQHDAFGNLIATKDALQNTVLVQFDARGRKVALSDPDTGLWTYDYDALGQLVWQQSPNQRATTQADARQTTMVYDKLGRMTKRVEPDLESTWVFDTYGTGGATCVSGLGKLCESSTTTGIHKQYFYDGLGRPTGTRTDTPAGPSFASAVAYDATNGRLSKQTYPTGLTVSYAYTAKGYVEALNLDTAATVNPLPGTVGGTPAAGKTLPVGSTLWRALAYNAWGKAEQQRYGNDVVNRAIFDGQTGRLAALSAGPGTASDVVDQAYTWDSAGRLIQRNDARGDGNTGAVTEGFGYDGLGRLQNYTVAAPAIPGLARTVSLQYNALGLLLYKSDVGVYSYAAQGAGAVRPHALQSVTGGEATSYGYDANGNLISASAGKYRGIAYTSFNLPDSQTGIQGPGGTTGYKWVYDENHARMQEVRTIVGGTAAGSRTTWNLHPDNAGGLGFESELDEPTSASTANPAGRSHRHYLSVGGVSIGVLVSTGALPVLGSAQAAPPLPSIVLVKVEYWHKDQLGSLVATTDHNAAVTGRYAYDAFGKRRYTNGSYDSLGNLVVDWSSATSGGTDRGFTGHEHLDDVGIVHMNGRLFDPTLGRFMQGDPFIQDPYNLQNYDRYGYCYNNPLSCTDPSGQRFFLTSIWKGLWHNQTIRLVASIAVAYYLGPAGGALNGITTNVVAQSAIAGFASGAIASGTLKGAIQGSFTAAMFAGAGNVIGGGNFFTAGTGQAWGSASGIALHGVVGCVTSVAGGGKCGPGALSAAFTKAVSPAIAGATKDDALLGTFAAAVTGGTASVIGGGKFANGAQSGAYSYLFNHITHLDDGNNAHKTIQTWAKRQGLSAEVTLYGTDGLPIGRADIVDRASDVLWEVKPGNLRGVVAGNLQLDRYTDGTGYSRGGDMASFNAGSSMELSGVYGDRNSYVYTNLGGGLVTYQIIKPPATWQIILEQLGQALRNAPPLFPPIGPRPPALRPAD